MPPPVSPEPREARSDAASPSWHGSEEEAAFLRDYRSPSASPQQGAASGGAASPQLPSPAGPPAFQWLGQMAAVGGDPAGLTFLAHRPPVLPAQPAPQPAAPQSLPARKAEGPPQRKTPQAAALPAAPLPDIERTAPPGLQWLGQMTGVGGHSAGLAFLTQRPLPDASAPRPPPALGAGGASQPQAQAPPQPQAQATPPEATPQKPVPARIPMPTPATSSPPAPEAEQASQVPPKPQTLPSIVTPQKPVPAPAPTPPTSPASEAERATQGLQWLAQMAGLGDGAGLSFLAQRRGAKAAPPVQRQTPQPPVESVAHAAPPSVDAAPPRQKPPPTQPRPPLMQRLPGRSPRPRSPALR
eukprot:Hpha_TRINITY_DN26040_c0_g1::TRINITY_DN26040_c0_g1_i1::g.115298::m.115298